MTNYPLGHDTAELRRLDAQAVLLHDPFLDLLAAKSAACLEIGCGSGGNIPLVKNANQNIRYTGIDISSAAIATAKSNYPHAEFHVMNGDDIQLEQKFDLIFTKLVLWSTGSALQKVLAQARRLLLPGGVFYALEPSNQFIHLYPPKPHFSAWMRAWDEAAVNQGMNPHIGPALPGHLIQAGFHHVACKFVPTISLVESGQHYLDVIDNMKGFFMGPAADNFELEKNHHLSRDKVVNELADVRPGSLVMDALFAAWGFC